MADQKFYSGNQVQEMFKREIRLDDLLLQKLNRAQFLLDSLHKTAHELYPTGNPSNHKTRDGSEMALHTLKRYVIADFVKEDHLDKWVGAHMSVPKSKITKFAKYEDLKLEKSAVGHLNDSIQTLNGCLATETNDVLKVRLRAAIGLLKEALVMVEQRMAQ